MVVIVIRYKKISADVSWRILLLACIPQFDTMHPSMTLGANFNDRIPIVFLNKVEIKIRKAEIAFSDFFISKGGIMFLL